MIRTKAGDITYGVEILDDSVEFIRQCTVTLIMAVPNVGKSLLAQNIACHIAKQGKKVLFCSCEMTSGLLMERELKKVMGVTSSQLIEGYKEHPSSIDKIFDMIMNDKEFEYLKNISILDIGGITINELIDVFDNNKEYNYIIVDYIQRIKGNGTTEYEQLKDVSYSLQIYAMEKGKAIIECSQIPKSVDTDARTIKAGIDFDKLRAKGGGNPEEDAHVAIKMAEDFLPDGKRCVLINISKNKYAKLKGITYKYMIDPRLNFKLLEKGL